MRVPKLRLASDDFVDWRETCDVFCISFVIYISVYIHHHACELQSRMRCGLQSRILHQMISSTCGKPNDVDCAMLRDCQRFQNINSYNSLYMYIYIYIYILRYLYLYLYRYLHLHLHLHLHLYLHIHIHIHLHLHLRIYSPNSACTKGSWR